jgi:hypothetical protein
MAHLGSSWLMMEHLIHHLKALISRFAPALMAFVRPCVSTGSAGVFLAGNSGLLSADQISLAPPGLARLTWITWFSKQSSAVTHSAQFSPA